MILHTVIVGRTCRLCSYHAACALLGQDTGIQCCCSSLGLLRAAQLPEMVSMLACVCVCTHVCLCWGVESVPHILTLQRVLHMKEEFRTLVCVHILVVEISTHRWHHHYRDMALVITTVKRVSTLPRGSEAGGVAVLSIGDRAP